MQLVDDSHPATRFSPADNRDYVRLGFPDPEDLRATNTADALYRWAPILKSGLFRILDLNLLPALHAVCLSHSNSPPSRYLKLL